jgi:hypothetical protein
MRTPAIHLPQYGTSNANTIAPRYIGDMYVKTDDGTVYVSKGTNPATDWIQVSN